MFKYVVQSCGSVFFSHWLQCGMTFRLKTKNKQIHTGKCWTRATSAFTSPPWTVTTTCQTVRYYYCYFRNCQIAFIAFTEIRIAEHNINKKQHFSLAHIKYGTHNPRFHRIKPVSHTKRVEHTNVRFSQILKWHKNTTTLTIFYHVLLSVTLDSVCGMFLFSHFLCMIQMPRCVAQLIYAVFNFRFTRLFFPFV